MRSNRLRTLRLVAIFVAALRLRCWLIFGSPLGSGFSHRKKECYAGMPECQTLFLGGGLPRAQVSSVGIYREREAIPYLESGVKPPHSKWICDSMPTDRTQSQESPAELTCLRSQGCVILDSSHSHGAARMPPPYHNSPVLGNGRACASHTAARMTQHCLCS